MRQSSPFTKLSNISHFLRLLSVEPLGFLTMFIFLFKKTAIDQMLQDKICLQRYRLPLRYCQQLPVIQDHQDPFQLKSKILADVTQFQMYLAIGSAFPVFGISLLIGPFIDKYGPAKRLLFIYASIIYLLDSISYLINSFWFDIDYRFLIISSAISSMNAGPLIGMTCCWAYLSSVTPRHMRSSRMIILEVFISTGMSTLLLIL